MDSSRQCLLRYKRYIHYRILDLHTGSLYRSLPVWRARPIWTVNLRRSLNIILQSTQQFELIDVSPQNILMCTIQKYFDDIYWIKIFLVLWELERDPGRAGCHYKVSELPLIVVWSLMSDHSINNKTSGRFSPDKTDLVFSLHSSDQADIDFGYIVICDGKERRRLEPTSLMP